MSRLLAIHTGNYRPPLRNGCSCGRPVQVLPSDTREGKLLLRCPTCDKTPQQCHKDGTCMLIYGLGNTLYDLCAKKLLIRGWAGIYTDEEEGFRKNLKPPSEAMKEGGRNLAGPQHRGL